MERRSFYFDHAATTPLDPRVRDAMLPWLGEDFGNANSLHHWGRKAYSAVEDAREAVAELVDAADPGEVVFTSGATEANNWVLSSFPSIVVSPFEHSSIREPALARELDIAFNLGWHLKEPEKGWELLSAMLVNNETGSYVDASSWFRVSGRFDETGIGARVIHRDLTQAAGKTPLHDHAYDLGSFSAHKFYGPKGVGALHMRGVSVDRPFIQGGEQEGGLRGGTLNVAAIVGMGEAARIALQEMEGNSAHVQMLRDIVRDELGAVEEAEIVERDQEPGQLCQSPYIVSAAFRGVQAEALVIELDTLGFGISSGAACSSRSTEPSHVLGALALDDEAIRGAVRLSFGPSNTADSTRQMAQALGDAVARLRRLA